VQLKTHFDKTQVAGIDDLIPRYRPEEFQSPTRSTVPLLSFLKHGSSLLDALLSETVGSQGLPEIHLEYTVKSPQGSGKASHTDAMLMTEHRACALEAKWTEPPYADVRTWTEEGKNPANRKAVLTGWLSLLQPFACRPLKLEEFNTATYQMVHRAASACSTRRQPMLAYLQFRPRPDLLPTFIEELQHGLTCLHGLLGPDCRLTIKLIEVTLKEMPAFERIKGLAKGRSQTSQAVQESLRSEVLFEFLNLKVHPIGG
jgi:hypothetical protein